MILVNKSRRDKAIVLTPGFDFVWIHHKLREHLGATKRHHTDDYGHSNDGIGYKKHVSLQLYMKGQYEKL